MPKGSKLNPFAHEIAPLPRAAVQQPSTCIQIGFFHCLDLDTLPDSGERQSQKWTGRGRFDTALRAGGWPSTLTIRPNRPNSDLRFTLTASSLWGSIKENLRCGIDRFGLVVRVGGIPPTTNATPASTHRPLQLPHPPTTAKPTRISI